MLEVRDLSVTLRSTAADLVLVEDISLSLAPGRTLGIVGESGSGKSILSLAVIGLLPEAARARGSIRLDGQELVGLPEEALCAIRGRSIGMVFQEPLTALNPAMSVGDQIAEGPRRHEGLDRRAARRRVLELLDRVGIPDAARRIDAYPHELSGGQRQRVGIAIALACRPRLLIADEPTTALDVTVQAQILDLLADLVAETGMGLILISHDLGVISERSDDTLVMYAGMAVERGPTAELFQASRHPYTAALLAAVPDGATALRPIEGNVPSPATRPPGCVFMPRCPVSLPECAAGRPAWHGTGTAAARCVRA